MIKDKSDLLSINILTYNRADFLKETVLSFISEVEKYNIPIYISNNCSTDNTIEVVEALKQIYPNIILNTNSENIGFDRNAVAVVNMSQSQYCWLFSDDDAVKEGAIETVIKRLEEGYDLLIVNASDYDKDLVVERKHSFGKDKDLKYDKGQHQQLFDDMVMYTTFLGCLVISKTLWQTVAKEKYYGTAFIHLGSIFEYIVNHRAYYISEPYIKMRADNSSWLKNKFKILNFTLPQTFSYLTDYDEAIKLRHANTRQIYSVKDLIRYKGEGQFSQKEYQMVVKNKLIMSPLDRFKLKCFAFCPEWVALLILRLKPKVYQRVKKERALVKLQTSYL